MKMKKTRLLWLGLILLVFPGLAWADCADVTRVTGHYVQGGHNIILYYLLRPVAYVNVPWCGILSESSVQLTSGYLCDGDKIIIDGVACSVFSVSLSSTSP